MAYRKGEVFKLSRGHEARGRTGVWVLSSDGRVADSDLNAHLRYLLAILLPDNIGDRLAALQELLQQQQIAADVACFWYGTPGTPFPTIAEDVCAAFAQLPAEIATDFQTDPTHTPGFKLQISAGSVPATSQLIEKFAERYLDTNDNRMKDERALSAGTDIRNGAFSKQNFRVIYEWKLEGFRRRNLPTLNLDRIKEEDIEDALRLAVGAHTPRAAIAVLVGLPGVRTRVASAILSMIWPDRFTILDRRALEGLGASNDVDDGSIDFYLAYLEECQKLADLYKVDLRTLDRALFQWSVEDGKQRLAAAGKIHHARPISGEVDYAELSREHMARYPKIRERLAK